MKLLLLSSVNIGQGLVEYALILMLIAIVVIGALTLLGGALGNTYSSIISRLPMR